MTDKTEDNSILSPEGTLHFASVKTPRKNAFSGKTEYSVRLEIDGSTEEGEAFRKTLNKINKNLIVEDAEGLKEGHYIINARSSSEHKPAVFDINMDDMEDEDVPMIESGTARVLVSPFTTKNKKGGGINLVGIQLLDVVEYQGAEPPDRDALRAKLKAALGKK
jgi:hypothetical protein